MRRSAGISAGLVAVLALALHNQLPNGEARDHAAGTAAESRVRPSKAVNQTSKESSAEGPCRPKQNEEYGEGPWLATRPFFYRPSEPQAESGCPAGTARLTDGAGLTPSVAARLVAPGESPAPAELAALLGLEDASAAALDGNWSVVATLPDPLHSRLSLTLDMQLDTLVRSFESAGWSLAGQWLPWLDPFDPTEKDIADRHKHKAMQREQEEMPGVLIFRGESGQTPGERQRHLVGRAMFVFVVPEIPTSGIGAAPFYAALHMARVLAPAHRTALLAPCYSGSFPILTQLLQRWRAKHPDDLHPRVYGGATASQTAADEFERDNPGFKYFVGIHDLDAYRFGLAQMQALYGLRPKDVALLKEDNSGYGRAFNRDQASEEKEYTRRSLLAQAPQWSEYRTYAFPRDIAHLRNAYREATSAATSKESGQDQSPRVGFSLKDAGEGEDSVPTFSALQTPLVQEAALLEVVRDIERTRVRLVFIAASNSLDALFLARLLRRECPDVRVVLDTPHVLFVAAALRESLSGLQFLSTYPLSFFGEEWLEAGSGMDAPPMLLASSDVQGLYNASLLLVKDIGALPNRQAVALRGYRQERFGRPYPPLWLLTLDRYGLRPVDLFDIPKPEAGWHLKNDPRGTAAPAARAALKVEYPVGWIFCSCAASFVSLLGCVWVWLCNRPGRPAAKPLWLYLGDAPRFRSWLLAWACLSWSALVWVMCLPGWRFWSAWSTQRMIFVRGVLLLALVACAAPPLVAFWAAWRHSAPRRKRKGRDGRLPLLAETALPAGVLLAGIVAAWGYLCLSDGPYGEFLCGRSVTMFSGASPALPLMLMCAGSCCFALFRLKRASLAGDSRPRLEFSSIFSPYQHDGEEIDYDSTSGEVGQSRYDLYVHGLRLKYRRLNQGINGESPDGWRATAVRLALGLAIAAAALGFLHPDPQAAERSQYNWVLLPAIGAMIFWLCLNCIDFITVGRSLDELLNLLEFLPLLPAFRRMVRTWPRRPIWTLRGSVPPTRLRRQWLRSLYCRLKIWKEDRFRIGRSAGYLRPGITLSERAIECERINEMSQTLIDSSIGSPRESGGTAEVELQYMKQQRRRAASLADMILRFDLHPAWLVSTQEQTAQREKAAPFDEYIRHASDYVAVVLFDYISYAFAQLRRLAECVSLGFLLLVLCLNSYHPLGPRTISRFLAVLFVAAGCVLTPVFARLDRNAIVSCVSRSRSGKLSLEFWLHILALGGLPLLAVLSHLFPEISGFLSSYLAPSIESLH